MSNLIAVWFTWSHPFYNWIDQDFFLEDMRRGELECFYCSPFLVNALPAAACPFSDYDEVRTRMGQTSKLKSDLVTEALRLLELEECSGQTPSIATAQGLVLLFQCFAGFGQDEQGWKYTTKAISICHEVATTIPQATDCSTDDQRVMAHAIDNICWGIFNFVNMVSFVYQKSPAMLPPPRPMPSGARKGTELWMPYPLSKVPGTGQIDEALQQYSKLSLIVRDAGTFLYAEKTKGNAHSDWQAAEDTISLLHQRLIRWRENLPAQLSLDEEPSPGLLVLHDFHQSLILTTFAPIRRQIRSQYSSDPSHDTPPSADMIVLTKDASSRAAHEIVRIGRLWQSAYTLKYTHVLLMHPAALAGFYFLIDGNSDPLHNPASPEYENDLLDLCVLFRAISRRWSFAFAFAALRMFQLIAQQRHTKLPKAAAALFQNFETEDWRRRHLTNVRSLYPVLDGAAWHESQNMGQFLEMMGRLDAAAGDEGPNLEQ